MAPVVGLSAYAPTFVNPWPVIAGAVCSFLLVLLAVELVIALVKSATGPDVPAGD